jgi:hypothetical protein
MSRFDRFMVHVDIGTDEKLARLTDAERLCHIAGVLAIAAKSPVRGRLLVGEHRAGPVEVARRAGVSTRVAKSTIDKLAAVGILVHDDEYDCWRVHHWERFNPEPRNDPTNAERQARHKAKRKASNAGGNGEVTPPVTPPEVEVEGEVGGRGCAPATPAAADRRLQETVAILSTAPRLFLDVERMGVANTLAAYPNADHVQAAHIAVANSSDPSYRTTDGAKALRYAIAELERRPRTARSAPSPSRSPSRLSEREERQNRRRETAMRLAAEQTPPQSGEEAA